jgi:drug/metabolite transporter (DMT)-like permease
VSSLLIQAEPVGAAIAAWVFLGEKVGLVQGIAMGVVLVSLGVLAWREARDVGLTLDEAIA